MTSRVQSPRDLPPLSPKVAACLERIEGDIDRICASRENEAIETVASACTSPSENQAQRQITVRDTLAYLRSLSDCTGRKATLKESARQRRSEQLRRVLARHQAALQREVASVSNSTPVAPAAPLGQASAANFFIGDADAEPIQPIHIDDEACSKMKQKRCLKQAHLCTWDGDKCLPRSTEYTTPKYSAQAQRRRHWIWGLAALTALGGASLANSTTAQGRPQARQSSAPYQPGAASLLLSRSVVPTRETDTSGNFDQMWRQALAPQKPPLIQTTSTRVSAHRPRR